jgi:hypothetical protein
LVTGTNQFIGNIGGNGITQVNAGSDLTANHVIQSALIIGGTATSHGLVTVDASGSSGNPLDQNLALPGSQSTDGPFGTAGFGQSPIDESGSVIVAGPLDRSSSTSSQAAVPEPASIMLLVIGGLAVVGAIHGRRSMRQRLTTARFA